VIITKRFVFVHMPKTGGTWLRDVLKKYKHPLWHLKWRPGHDTSAEAPPGLPILGTVRNPWDWYVSWYFFRCREYKDRTGLFAPDHPKRQDWEALMKRWEEHVNQPDARTREGFLRVLPRLMEPGVLTDGTYTQTHERFFERGRPVHLARFETLGVDVTAFLKENRIPNKLKLRTALRTAPRKNTSSHGPYRDYYDEDARDLVARADRAIIARYGYEF
jgi:hypothetical protein